MCDGICRCGGLLVSCVDVDVHQEVVCMCRSVSYVCHCHKCIHVMYHSGHLYLCKPL